MRTSSQRYGAHASSTVRERRFYIKIEPNPGTPADDIYIVSNSDVTIGAAGTVLAARILSARISTQRLNPDEGRATIGSMSFDVLDVNGSFTTRLRTELLTNGRGLRGKRCTVYNGFRELSYDEYEIEDTQVVESVKYRAGARWSVQCRDIQREMRKTIFEPVVMYLTQPLSETATTIEVNSTAGLQAVEHGTSYSDAPSSTVAYVKIDDEIIRVPAAGIGATQLTNCVRGRLRTRAAEHTTDETAGTLRGKEVSEVIYLELPVPKLVYGLLTGVLIGQTGTLPDHWHLGIDASDYVRLSEFQTIGADLYVSADDTAGMKELYILTGSEDGKRFIEREVLRKYGLFLPVHANGELGLRRGQPVLSGSATVGTISDRFIIGDVELRFDMTKIINVIEIGWNYIDDEPSRRLTIEDTESIAAWGRASVLEVGARGLAGSIHTDSRVRDLYESLRDRYSGPPILTSVDCQASLFLFEVGDVVRVQTSHVKDFTNTVTDSLDRAFEIQGVTKNLMTGRTKFDLFGSSQRAGPLPPLESATPLPDSYYTAAGTDLASLPGVVDGGAELTLPNGLTITGNADVTNAAAIYYATKSVRIPTGNVVDYTQNVQLRIRGTLTVDGELNGAGNGLVGIADTYDINNFPATFATAETVALPALQGGTPGYFGSTQGDGGIFDHVRQRSGSTSRYRAFIQSIPATVTQGEVEAIPSLNLDWNGTVLSGLPTDLRGTSGGPGGIRYWEDYRDNNVNVNRGGTGGTGGAGLLVICRGMSFGASGRIDSSGSDGGAPAYNAADERPAWSGGGAGGAPGATIIVLDGAAVATPILTSGSIIADYGATPKPGGSFNQLTSALVRNSDTRFGAPSINRAFIREDRFSFYESAASGRSAGIAAARYFFLLPQVTPEEDTDDISLADGQSISIGVTEAYGNRLDNAVTSLIATITENSTTNAYSHANIYSRVDGTTAWTLQGPAEPSLEFELPADGNTYEVMAVPVLINGQEASTGQIQTEVVSNGAAFGAQGGLTNNLPPGYSDFETLPAGAAGYFSLSLGSTIHEITTAQARLGKQCLTFDGSATGGGCYSSGTPLGLGAYHIPMLPNRRWLITGWVRATVTNGSYLLQLLLDDGSTGQFVSGAGVTLSAADSWEQKAWVVDCSAYAFIRGRYRISNVSLPAGANAYVDGLSMLDVTDHPTLDASNFPTQFFPSAQVNGAIAGINLRDESLAILSDIDVRNDRLVTAELGAINDNPSMRRPQVHPSGAVGPAGWTTNEVTPSQPTYENNAVRDVAMMSAANIEMVNTAFLLNPDTEYEVIALVAVDGAGPLNFDIRINELDTELPSGKTYVAVNTNSHGSQAATRTLTPVDNYSLTGGYQIVRGTLSPTSTAKWASVSLWNNNGGFGYRVEWCAVRDKSNRTNQLPDLGGLIYNSAMRQRDYERDRPAGWYLGDTTDPTAAFYQDAAKTILALGSAGDSALGIHSTAFPVDPNTPRRIKVRLRGDVASASGLYIRIGEYDSDLPEGVLWINRSATAPSPDNDTDVLMTREVLLGQENVAVPAAWTEYSMLYPPTASARWASVHVLNWTGHGTNQLWISRVTAEPELGGLANLDQVDTTDVIIGAMTAFGRYEPGNTNQADETVVTDYATLVLDVGQDAANCAALVTLSLVNPRFRRDNNYESEERAWRFICDVNGVDVDSVLARVGFQNYISSINESRAYGPITASFLVDGSDLVNGNNTFKVQGFGDAGTIADFVAFDTGNSSYFTVQVFKRT